MGTKVKHCCHYPQFAAKQRGEVLKPGEEPKRYSMHNAARILAEGGNLIKNKESVLESDGATRRISKPEQQQIMAMRKDWKQLS